MNDNRNCRRIFSRTRNISDTAKFCPREFTSCSWEAGVCVSLDISAGPRRRTEKMSAVERVDLGD